MLAEASIKWYSSPMQMTTKTPAVIYSAIVETLQSCRANRFEAHSNAEEDLDPYTFDIITTECSAAVEQRRDIEDFRGVCEEILEKVLRLRQVMSSSVTRGIHPRFKMKMVKAGLMERSDSCHPHVKDFIALADAKKKEKENCGLKS